ncbi:MAG: Ig-like domain-containing protein, partial [Verrucomicrobiota bacterium]
GASLEYVPSPDFNGSDSFTYRVGNGVNVSGIARVSITVTSVEDIPVAQAANVRVTVGDSVVVKLEGFDGDKDKLTYSVTSLPSKGTLSGTAPNLVYKANTNVIGADSFTFRVNDGKAESSRATVAIEIEKPVNKAPTFVSQSNRLIRELALTSFRLSARDADVPAQTLTFGLVSGPKGLTVAADGLLTWTPTEEQGPGTNLVTVRVTDNGVPSLSATNAFILSVSEANTAPTFINALSRSIFENAKLTVQLTPRDADLPPQRLTTTLVSGPVGLTVSASGLLEWTPTEAQGPSTNRVVVRLTDDAPSPLSTTATFTLTVREANAAPVFPATNAIVAAQAKLMLPLVAADSDIPVQALRYGLVRGPAGLTVSTNGLLEWTPPATAANTTNNVTVSVTDGVASVTSVVTIVCTSGVAKPQFTAQPAATTTLVAGQNGRLTATVTGAGVSLQWRLNGNPVAGATNATLTLSSVTAAQGGTYTLVASNAGGSVTSDAAVVAVAEVLKDLSSIRSGLLAYLPFDGNASDLSGRGNNGTPVGAPTYAAGKVGSGALAFSSAKDGSSFKYVTLGTNLVTGTNSFSVAFWAKLDAWTGDPSFISNKDWNSGGNVGWVVATAGDGRIQWNFRSKGDPQPARRDYDSPGGYFNGAVWRHIVVTFDVTGKASTYVNGDLIDSRDVGPVAAGPDSGLPINIGQDGKGTYTDGNSVGGQGLIDEVALWGRVLSPVEAASLYQGGNAGNALVVPTVVTGQWDFNGNLDATVGTALQYLGDTASITAFRDATIGGKPAKVMSFGAATKAQGYVMTHGAGANGGGTKLNQYTLIMDVMFPAASDAKWRGLFQTDPSNANDGDLFVNKANGIGISGQYQGKVVADTWHRLAFAFNLNDKSVSKYIDGVLVNKQTLGEGFDGRWALGSTALLFTDEDGETAAGMVNSVQIRNGTLSDAEIAALGGATADGIPAVRAVGSAAGSGSTSVDRTLASGYAPAVRPVGSGSGSESKAADRTQLSMRVQPDQSLALSVVGPAGARYRVESSGFIGADWQPVDSIGEIETLGEATPVLIPIPADGAGEFRQFRLKRQ